MIVADFVVLEFFRCYFLFRRQAMGYRVVVTRVSSRI